MKKLFITSDAHSVAHNFPHHVDLSQNNKLVFIDTAAEPEKVNDTTWLKNDRLALVKAGFNVIDYTITGKNKKELENFLPQFDFIYCSGGVSAHLLSQSYKTGFIDVVKDLVLTQGKTYIGTSAGSILTGPRLLDYFPNDEYPDIAGKPAFGFVNFSVIPHWGSDNFKDMYLGERIKLIYDENQPPFILLANHQYIKVFGNDFSIIDVKN